MTFLVGRQAGTTPVTGSPASNAGDAFWFSAVAAASGTASTVQLRVGDWTGGATAVKVCVYDNSDNLLAVSGVFTSADGTGLLSKAISCSITNGQTYKIAITEDTQYINVVGYTDLTSISMPWATGGHFSYASPPSTLPTPDATNTKPPWEVWLDGSVGGSTAGRNRMLMGFG